MKRIVFFTIIALLVASCNDRQAGSKPREMSKALQELNVTTSKEFAAKHKDFKSYWFRGLAELNRFELQQSRYGEIHEGEAVMIFVTEPFLTGEQVKRDFGDAPAVQVLKNNFYRRFYTGIYPYTMLTSTFTPANDGGPTIKMTQSMQEWCGHVYTQLNLNDAAVGYDAKTFSYFQSEGDREFPLAGTLIEDDLYTRIRLGPDKLPTGEVQILPSSTYLRLAHKPWEVKTATIGLSAAAKSEFSDEPTRTYSVRYAEPARELKIFFEAAFPHRIVGFEDTYSAIFNPNGGAPQQLTTVGRLTNSIMLDYWAKHGNKDAAWRDALGLQF